MITYPQPEDVLYYAGHTFRVEWYYTEAGMLPGLEYYLNLDAAEQERLDHMVKYLADALIGTLLPSTMYRIEDRDEKLYAFKPGAHRFFTFMAEGRCVVITNAYRKHSQRMNRPDRQSLRIAADRRIDYLRRVLERTYYEKG